LTIQKRVTVASSRFDTIPLGSSHSSGGEAVGQPRSRIRLPQNRVIFLTNFVKKSDISIRRSYK
jgi:hypothetical protein